MEHLNRCFAGTDRGKSAWHKHSMDPTGFPTSQFVVSGRMWRWPQNWGFVTV